MAVLRSAYGLNWGAGPELAAGWINSDRDDHPGLEHVGDLLDGLPWTAGAFRYVVTHHALQMLGPDDVVRALFELRRVTAVDGWLRLSVPDLGLALDDLAEDAGESFLRRLFPLERGPGSALTRYLTHYGQRTYWTFDYAIEVLAEAGWSAIPSRCSVGQTRSPWPFLAHLDGRPRESLILEAANR